MCLQYVGKDPCSIGVRAHIILLKCYPRACAKLALSIILRARYVV